MDWDTIHTALTEDSRKMYAKIQECRDYVNKVLKNQYSCGIQLIEQKKEDDIRNEVFWIYIDNVRGGSDYKKYAFAECGIKPVEWSKYHYDPERSDMI